VIARPFKIPLLLCLCSGLIIAGSRAVPGEYEMKAAFLVNFTHFVEWPASGDATAPFPFCIVGSDPFGKTLEKVVGQRTVGGRPIVVRRLLPTSDLTGCRIAFLSEENHALLNKALGALEQEHALTVGEAEHFAERGGMVGLVVENDHVCIELNTKPAERAGLKISSQLIHLAKRVGENGKEAPR
jgi:hypothetical protein